MVGIDIPNETSPSRAKARPSFSRSYFGQFQPNCSFVVDKVSFEFLMTFLSKYLNTRHTNIPSVVFIVLLRFCSDVPCEFCEQLIKHLRDTMVANTTELEFYKVLQGMHIRFYLLRHFLCYNSFACSFWCEQVRVYLSKYLRTFTFIAYLHSHFTHLHWV